MIINLKSLSLLAPVFVSFFWASILMLRNFDSRRPGFYMAWMMIAIVLIFLSIVPFYNNNILLYALLDPIFFLGITSLFPIVFFYIRSITLRKRFTLKDWLHFTPAFLFMFVSILLHSSLSGEERNAYSYNAGLSGNHPHLDQMITFNILVKIIIGTQMIFYFFQSHFLIQDYRKRIEDYFSTIEVYFFRWIPFFYVTYAGSALAGLLLLALGNSELNDGKAPVQIISFLFLSSVFFIIGYIANHQRYIENGQFYLDETEKESPSYEPVPPGDPVPHFPGGLKEKLESYMISKKPYLDPSLKITDLARDLQTNRTYISRMIRSQYNQNFNSYINTCRIKESLFLLNNTNYQHITSRGISEMVGFNNYNTFVKAFKDAMGVTPGRFRGAED